MSMSRSSAASESTSASFPDRARVTSLLAALLLVVGLVAALPAVSQAEEHPPQFSVDRTHGSVWGHGWPANAVLTVTVGEPASAPDFVDETVPTDAHGNFEIWNLGHDIQAGDEVVVFVTDDVTTRKEHVVTALQITEVDVGADTVSGTTDSPDGSVVVVEIHEHMENGLDEEIGLFEENGFFEPIQREAIVTGGTWTADFGVESEPGADDAYDIDEGTSLSAQEFDDDGDSTVAGWQPPMPPTFTVDPVHSNVWGHGWLPETEVTVTVNDPGDGGAEETTDSDEWGNFDVWFDGFNIQVGDEVTVTDGETTWTHIVADLTIDGVDYESDAFWGSAASVSEVVAYVEDFDAGEFYVIEVTADVDGEWLADFAGIVDLTTSHHLAAAQYDHNGNATQVGWHVQHPVFRVDPDVNSIWGHGWGAFTGLTVTVNETEFVDDAVVSNAWGDFDLHEISFDIQPGHEVVVFVTDDATTRKDHTVTTLAITEINTTDDTISGTTGSPDPAEIAVHVHVGEEMPPVTRSVTTAGGAWLADFSVPGDSEWEQETVDLGLDSHGGVGEFDDDGDATMIGWHVGPTAPGAPQNLAATPGDTQVGLTWSAPADDGGREISGYVLTLWPTGSPENDDMMILDASPTSTTLVGLTNGTSYAFTVAAFNEEGVGEAAGPVTATPTAPSTGTGPGPAPSPTPVVVGSGQSVEAQPGQTVTTDSGTGATEDDPLQVSITSPTGGTVAVEIVDDPAGTPTGFSVLGAAVQITAPDASAEDPLVLGFEIDASLLDGLDPADVTVFRDGVAVADCAGTVGVASPDPCVSSRSLDSDGDLVLTVLTSQASLWAFGAATCPVAPFTDVNRDGVHAPGIDCAAALGIAVGTTATTFSPRGLVTRAQMASFIARTLAVAGFDLPVGADAFDDIGANKHAPNIRMLAAAGIVQGTGERTYSPHGLVTRAQMAAFLVRAFEWATGETIVVDSSPFTDVDPESTHATSIDRAAAAGLTTGRTATTYAPSEHVSRAQMATFMVRLLERIE